MWRGWGEEKAQKRYANHGQEFGEQSANSRKLKERIDRMVFVSSQVPSSNNMVDRLEREGTSEVEVRRPARKNK